jgi:hypothetical protein
MQSSSNYQINRIWVFKIESFDEKRLFLLIFVENIKLSLLETLLSPFKSAISLHGWLQASMGMFT